LPQNFSTYKNVMFSVPYNGKIIPMVLFNVNEFYTNEVYTNVLYKISPAV